MIYEKNGELRDSKKFLVSADGKRTIFNPKPKDWLAEGWVEYKPQEEAKVIKLTPSLEDVRERLLEECRQFYENEVLKFKNYDKLEWIPAADRVVYVKVLEDALTFESTVTYEGKEYYIPDILTFFKKLNIYEIQAREVRERHLSALNSYASIEDLENHDFTAGYPEILTFMKSYSEEEK